MNLQLTLWARFWHLLIRTLNLLIEKKLLRGRYIFWNNYQLWPGWHFTVHINWHLVWWILGLQYCRHSSTDAIKPNRREQNRVAFMCLQDIEFISVRDNGCLKLWIIYPSCTVLICCNLVLSIVKNPLALLMNHRLSMSLILLCCWPLFGYECIGSCENKRAEPGRNEFVWMRLPVSLTSMSKTSRITSKLRQVVTWTLRTRRRSKLWCFSS